MRTKEIKLALPILLLMMPVAAQAAIHYWPGSAPCNTTLNACIDAATDGDTIKIASNGPIDENLYLYDRSLWIGAAEGFHPIFEPNNSIYVSSSQIAGDMAVSLAGIKLLNGDILVSYNSTGSATFDLRDLQAKKIVVTAGAGSTVEATLYNNRVIGVPYGIDSGSLWINNEGATLNANLYFNHVTSTSASAVDGAAILVDGIDGASGEVNLLGNVVRGDYSRGGIFVSSGHFASTPSNFQANVTSNVVICPESSSGYGSGIHFATKYGNLDAYAINNTVSGCDWGVQMSQWSGGSPSASINGTVSNNILVGPGYGLYFIPLALGMSNDNNLINAPIPSFGGIVLGSGTITDPAELVAPSNPRLRPSSPAIDSANTLLLGLALLGSGMPVLDADGLRRLKGEGDVKADIGAFEFGDMNFMHHVSASSSSHISAIMNPLTDGDSSLDLFATPNYNAGGAGPDVSVDIPFGSWYDSANWTLFAEDTSVDMPDNAHFNVFLPAAGRGVFRHTASSANSNGYTTTLDDPSVNDLPDRIVLVNQNYTAGAAHNNHPVGVLYYGIGGTGDWSIINMDQQGPAGYMPVGAGFSVYAQAPSPNALRVTQLSTSPELVLDHPLLNDTPCAQVAVTAVYGGSSSSTTFDVFYGHPGRWRIYSYNGIAAGAQFHVLVNPAQVALCTADVIFADGFD